ncbi:MAG: hypothetical protein WKF68_05170 [Daejeonella sp.]
MKKFAPILFILLLCSFNSWSQKIKYEDSIEKAERLSMVQNKVLCILITMQPPAHVTNFLSGLKDPAVVTKFNENFINYTIDRADTISRKIIRKYKVVGFPAFIFVDSKGGLMFKKFGSMPPPILLSMADEAIAAGKGKSLIDFEKQYASGDRSTGFMRDYINKRISAGITSNAELIEQYTNNLYIKDLDNYGQVLFILKAGPLADGRAYSLAHSNKKIIDSIFKTELFDVRVNINNRIIENTMASAVAAKNITRAYASANYLRNSWNSDRLQGQKNHSRKMLQYHQQVKDTSNYLRAAGQHYDQYYMNISVDSIRRLDQKTAEREKSRVNEQAARDMPPGGGIRSVSYAFPSSTFAMELNNGAYSIFESGTKNAVFLSKAMLWSKRSIELSPNSASYDTLSHLLYRLGFYTESETTQVKALELARTEKQNVKHLQDEFVKIKNRTL